MSSSIFGQEISKQNQPTLFGAFQAKTENEEQKTNISSSLFNNEKPSLFGNMFNPNGIMNKNLIKKIKFKILYLDQILKKIYLNLLIKVMIMKALIIL